MEKVMPKYKLVYQVIIDNVDNHTEAFLEGMKSLYDKIENATFDDPLEDYFDVEIIDEA